MSNPFDEESKQSTTRNQDLDDRNVMRVAVIPKKKGPKTPDRSTTSHPSIGAGSPELIDSKKMETGKVAIDNGDANAIARFFVSNRVYGYPLSDGTMSSNYKHFVFNNHPVISICLATWGQPYNMKKRIIVFICTLSMAIGISYVLVHTDYVHQLTVCREGCKVNETVASKICAGGLNNGLPYGIYDGRCAYYRPWMLSAVCGTVLVPYGSLLQFLATCGCVQGRSFFQESWVGKKFRCFVELCGGELLMVFQFISLAIVVWTIIETYLRKSGFAFFQVILVSKVWSLGIWFLWTVPFFFIKFPRDKEYFFRRQADKNNKNNNENAVDEV